MRLAEVLKFRPPPSPDIRRAFGSLAEWQAFAAAMPAVLDPARIAMIVGHARERGVASAYLGPVPPARVEVLGTNYREGLMAGGLNPRQRAVLDLIAEDPRAGDPHQLRMFAHEAMTPFALALRGRFTRLLCSEYAAEADAAGRARLFPVPIIDVMRSGLPDASIDLVISNEVFEHIPDLGAALRDTARILAPGGRLLATFPFHYGREATDMQAVLEGGVVRHLALPEYHGNPADPEAGSLVFSIPGWGVLALARDCGFGRAEMLFWSSAERGITGAEIAGVFVLDARR